MDARTPADPARNDAPPARPLRELALLFLRLGTTAFGGPLAHIALMREEVVRRKRWLDDAQFLDLVGAANLIPGPNSTELAIHIGRVRAGWRGLLVAGLCFLLPSVLLTSLLAWAYVRYGATPSLGWFLAGIRPVVLAIVVHALLGLAPRALASVGLRIVGAGALLAALLGANELLVLLAGGFLALLFARGAGGSSRAAGSWIGPLLVPTGAGSVIGAGSAVAAASTTGIFAVFLKVGALLYGSGYVLLAFLRADLVLRLGWIDEQQLCDAVAASQLTPGPLFSAATFLGYLLDGPGGALVATVGIFLPAFVFVAASGPLVARLRGSPGASAFLNGVNVASLALMAAVLLPLGRSSINDAPAALVGLLALVLLARLRIAPVWLLAGGALWGWCWQAG